MWYENDTLLGDSWSLCAWTVRHVLRHHVSKMERLQRRLLVRVSHHHILPGQAHIGGSEQRRRCDKPSVYGTYHGPVCGADPGWDLLT